MDRCGLPCLTFPPTTASAQSTRGQSTSDRAGGRPKSAGWPRSSDAKRAGVRRPFSLMEEASRLLLGFFLLGLGRRRRGGRSRGVGGLGRIRRRGGRSRSRRRRRGRSRSGSRRGRLFAAGGEHGNDHRSKEQRLFHSRFPFKAARGLVQSDRRAALFVLDSNAAIAIGADYSCRAATTAEFADYLERGIRGRAVRPEGCARPHPSGGRTAPPTSARAARD